jgi:ribosomal protein S18 acetylase RimI-like enzyme
MPLPVLKTPHAADDADLLRLFYQSERQWCAHLGEETTLDAGSAITNPQTPDVWDANALFDAALPEGQSPADFLRLVEDHYASQGTRCATIILNPSQPAGSAQALETHLFSIGFRQFKINILAASPPALRDAAAPEGVKIIPARASFKHLRALIEEWTAPLGVPGFADVTLLHYDDPRYDALLALKDGVAIGHVGVFALGEVGRIDDVYITPGMRNQRLGTVLVSRAAEICQRSLFRHVLLSVDPQNAPAQRLYASFGCRRIGDFIAYRAPWTAPAASGGAL